MDDSSAALHGRLARARAERNAATSPRDRRDREKHGQRAAAHAGRCRRFTPHTMLALREPRSAADGRAGLARGGDRRGGAARDTRVHDRRERVAYTELGLIGLIGLIGPYRTSYQSYLS